MTKKYIVDLTADEHTELLTFIKKGQPGARKVARAHILLLTDEGRTDVEIASSLHVSLATVERTRKKFVEGGIVVALNEQKRGGVRLGLWTMGTIRFTRGKRDILNLHLDKLSRLSRRSVFRFSSAF